MALRKRKCSAMSTRRPSKRPKTTSDENSDEAPSSYLPAAQDPDNCVTIQSVAATRQQLPMEIVGLILSEFITGDALKNRYPCEKGSRLRKWRRRDICSVLLTSREVYKEASKLMHERLDLTIRIDGSPEASQCMCHLRRIGCPGPWNRFHKIKIYIRPLHHFQFAKYVPSVIDALEMVWKLLRSHLHTTDKGLWQEIELICNADIPHWDRRSIWLKAGWWRPERQIRLRELIQMNDTWTPILRFDANLRFLSEVDLES